jgi:large subunit ribosomal protein L9
MDIAKAITEQSGLEVDRHNIVLDRPIKNTGDTEVEVKLGHDLNVTVKISVSAEGAEASSAE